MTLDEIDSVADQLGDHYLVPMIRGLTEYIRQLESRVAELEGSAAEEDSYRQERIEQERIGRGEPYEVASDAATPPPAPHT